MRDKNLWPLAIAVFMTLMVCMIILTIYISIQNKPDEDNAYFSTRQDIDKNINEILINQAQLMKDSSFYIKLDSADSNFIALSQKTNRKANPILIKPDSAFKLLLKVDGKIGDFKEARLFITRFASAKDDLDLGILKQENNLFTTPEISLKKGDWKAMIEFTINDKKAYFEQLIRAEI